MTRSSTCIATPPGATIKEQLNGKGMSQKEFAARMDMSEKHISKLVNGEVRLTPDVAVRLEIVLGVPAQFWNNLEAMYREKLLKVEAENSMDEDAALARMLPYGEMAGLEWVPYVRDTKKKVAYLRKYFEVISLHLLENRQITRIASRRLSVTDKNDLTMLAWAQQARIIARTMETLPINIKGLLSAIPDIQSMTNHEPKAAGPELRNLLSRYGVAFVILPQLKGMHSHGASFIEGSKIVIGIAARGETADEFWFNLFHEIAHIVLGHIGQADGTTEEDERNADLWAENALKEANVTAI